MTEKTADKLQALREAIAPFLKPGCEDFAAYTRCIEATRPKNVAALLEGWKVMQEALKEVAMEYAIATETRDPAKAITASVTLAAKALARVQAIAEGIK